jgi:hypothetical protein
MRIDPSRIATGHQVRSQLSAERFALLRAVTDTAAHPETCPGAVPISGRAPGMSAVVMPRGPK